MKKASLLLLALYAISSTVSVAADAQKFVIGAQCYCGLFAVFIRTLSTLDWTRRTGKTPVIYWDTKMPYYQHGGYEGTKNVWEYYFEPVSHLSYQPGDSVYQHSQTPDNSASPENVSTYDEAFHT